MVAKNPVPHGLSTRRPNRRVPLIRTPRTLPRVIDPGEADALLAALRTHRDRAMVQVMLLGGLRRCEVLGLRLPDVQPGEKRLFIADGKGGHSGSFRYLRVSSPPWPATWSWSGPRPPRRIGCSWCSRANVADCR